MLFTFFCYAVVRFARIASRARAIDMYFSQGLRARYPPYSNKLKYCYKNKNIPSMCSRFSVPAGTEGSVSEIILYVVVVVVVVGF